MARNYGSINDNVLCYAKGQDYIWNQQYTAFPPEYVTEKFTGKDPDGRRYQNVTLRNPGVRPNLRERYVKYRFSEVGGAGLGRLSGCAA